MYVSQTVRESSGMIDVAWRFHWAGLAERDMYAQAGLVSLKMCYKMEGILFYTCFCFV